MLRSETAQQPERRIAALAGLRAFQQAARPAPQPAPPVCARVGRVMLRDYGGAGRPVVFVPSLINPPSILDLGETSLLRWMAARGVRTLQVDWGIPGTGDRNLGMTAHVETLLIPLLEQLERPPVLVGYCLGGTLALAAAAATQVAGVAAIAAPWRFAGYGDARAPMLRHWAMAEPACEALGLVPMEVLQAGFWRLDPARTIAKYEAFGRLDPGSAAAASFIRLEDWANAGAPLPLAFARDLFRDCVGADRPGTGDWIIRGRRAAPTRLRCPRVEFVSTTDRIVPAATAAGLAQHRPLTLGHVGMMVGRRAEAMLWQPLADWIAALPRSRRRATGAGNP